MVPDYHYSRLPPSPIQLARPATQRENPKWPEAALGAL